MADPTASSAVGAGLLGSLLVMLLGPEGLEYAALLCAALAGALWPLSKTPTPTRMAASLLLGQVLMPGVQDAQLAFLPGLSRCQLRQLLVHRRCLPALVDAGAVVRGVAADRAGLAVVRHVHILCSIENALLRMRHAGYSRPDSSRNRPTKP